MTIHREIITAGGDCIAFVVIQPDGTATVHIIRPGEPSLTVMGAGVTTKATKEIDDGPTPK